MKKILVRLAIFVLIVGSAWGGYKLYKSLPQTEQTIATAKVRKGDVIVRSYTRGELRAVRSQTLFAPNLFGTVQVTRLAQLGSFAREKDLVIEFDDSEVLSRLEEKQLELDQIDEQMKKAQAELAIRNNQDQVELLQARYSVRRAELEVKRNVLVSEIDAKKNLLTLDESQRRLKQLESDIKSRLESAQAELAVLRERRNKAQLELARERTRLNQVKLLSPMAGLISVRQNMGGGFRIMGAQVPDIREGDQVQPGIPVADVLDLSELEVSAKVGELDRANLRDGQEVSIQLDAIPDKSFSGRIKAMSATASANMFSGDPAKKFDVVFSIEMKQLLSALGAKPDQVARILATAEQNRKKPAVASNPMMAGGMPGMGMGGAVPEGMAAPGAAAGSAPPGAVPPGAAPMVVRMGAGPGAEGETPGGPGGPGGEGRRQIFTMGPGGAGGGSPGGGMSQEDRNKMREAFQKALGGRNMQDLTPEERTEIMNKLRKDNPTLFAGRGGGPGAATGQAGAQGGERAGRRQRSEEAGGPPEAQSEGRGRRGGAESPGGPGGGMRMFGMGGGGQQFSEKDLSSAKLPPAPEDDSQIDVLLRPGLLADVEIIVEKVPNAIHIPAQAVLEREGKMIVHVKNGSKWEAREIKPLKRSESTMVIASGLKPGEEVALSDPNAKPGDKNKQKTDSGGGASPMGGMPAGGAGGGGRGGR